jgi:hypothetical protein
MRCIFCKEESSRSRSVEHIIPESLGNTTQVLRPGIVCDRCNNYFAREVEKPFLDHPAVSLLRFQQGLGSKRGRVPPAAGVFAPSTPVVLRRSLEPTVPTTVDVPPEVFRRLAAGESGALILPAELPPPDSRIVSRFLAKVALEAVAQRWLANPAWIEQLVDDPQFDPVRDHARRGRPARWATHTRRIYDPHARWAAGDAEQTAQVVFEYDVLVTASHEWYLILALFGREYAINVGGPDLDGYVEWLKAHAHASPLYHGKNAHGAGTSSYPASD